MIRSFAGGGFNEGSWEYTDSKHRGLRYALRHYLRGQHMVVARSRTKPHKLAPVRGHDRIGSGGTHKTRYVFTALATNYIVFTLPSVDLSYIKSTVSLGFQTA